MSKRLTKYCESTKYIGFRNEANFKENQLATVLKIDMSDFNTLGRI